jgi:kinesin family protein 2/24
VFCYGQTGSGKTHTMGGIQEILAQDLFLLLSSEEQNSACSLETTAVMVSFFELYGGFLQDLLNDRKRLKILEDGKGEINVTGLQEFEASDSKTFLELMETGMNARTTHMTEANDTSSRSHAICQITLRDRKTNRMRGKLSLVDLAGSERGTDTKSHNAQRRAESADINTSLLSLKECIRALDMNKNGPKHVPYRGSKLTLILKDCFTSEHAMTTMIATVSPGASAADHTLNTLRYADRIKEKRVPGQTRAVRSPKGSRQAVAPLSPLWSPQNTGASVVQPQTVKMASFPPLSPVHPAPSKPLTRAQATQRDSWKDSGKEEKVEAFDKATLLKVKSEEFESVVASVFEQEEALLNLHMTNIQENADLLSAEGQLLHSVQRDDVSDQDIEDYVNTLEKILDAKEDMILALQDKIIAFQNESNREKELTKELEELQT